MVGRDDYSLLRVERYDVLDAVFTAGNADFVRQVFACSTPPTILPQAGNVKKPRTRPEVLEGAPAVRESAETPSIGASKRNTRYKILAAVLVVALIGAGISFFLLRAPALEIPEGGIRDVVILTGRDTAPCDFLTLQAELEAIVAEFLEPEAINTHMPGRHIVNLGLAQGRRRATVPGVLYVLSPVDRIEVEAGTAASEVFPFFFVPGMEFVNSSSIPDVSFVDGMPDCVALEVGLHTVRLRLGNEIFESELNIVDTTPPTAIFREVTVPMGQIVSPQDFIIEIHDMSDVTNVLFNTEPYVFMPGEQTVEIFLQDYFGNYAIYPVVLTVLPNTVPPVILGTQDIFTQMGSTIMFRSGVTAQDAFERPVTLGIDSSDVNIHEIGVYTVIFYAVDAWGLRTEVTQEVHVLAIDPEVVRGMADVVLAGILREGMTQVEEARAIFDWIGANVGYAANISHRSLYEDAYQALRNRRGDCFVFFAAAELLLTRAEIPNMQIVRYGGQQNHAWNLINPDELGWHHFDATPVNIRVSPRINRFMFTSSEAARFTEIMRVELWTPNYYTYDPELYPDIVQ